MHAVVNDAARKIEDRINTVEPKFGAKARQSGDSDTAAQVTITGSAELPAEKHDYIKKMLDDAIEGSLKR
jgi:hypothetical protein